MKAFVCAVLISTFLEQVLGSANCFSSINNNGFPGPNGDKERKYQNTLCNILEKNYGSDFFYYVPGDSYPDAPSLAHRGSYGVGYFETNVQVNSTPNFNMGYNLTNRVLPISVWFPYNENATCIYSFRITNPSELNLFPNDHITYPGRCNSFTYYPSLYSRSKHTTLNAPLVILSHGFPGQKIFWSHLGENLASKGYVVVAIDHTDSLWTDSVNGGPFGGGGSPNGYLSSIYYRRYDIRSVLNQIESWSNRAFVDWKVSAGDLTYILSGAVNSSKTAVGGYSFGGYGAFHFAGAAVTQSQIPTLQFFGMPQNLINDVLTPFQADPRVLCYFTYAPYGGAPTQLLNQSTVGSIQAPFLIFGGTHDHISLYTEGIRNFYSNLQNAYLVSYQGVRHAAGAFNPRPENMIPLSYSSWDHDNFGQNFEMRRLNQYGAHFVTAFLGQNLLGQNNKAYFAAPLSTNIYGPQVKNLLGFAEGTSILVDIEASNAALLPSA